MVVWPSPSWTVRKILVIRRGSFDTLRRKRSPVGFSLVELLASISILLLLLSLAAPAMVQAKKQARHSADLHSLKQLGVAGAIYSDRHVYFPRSCRELVQEAIVPVIQCSGLADRTSEGWAERSGRAHGFPSMHHEQRNSFIGSREFGFGESYLELRPDRDRATNWGWLLDVSPAEPFGEIPRVGPMSAPFRRLLRDGAVVRRSQLRIVCGDRGQQHIIFPVIAVFADYDVSWRQERCQKFLESQE